MCLFEAMVLRCCGRLKETGVKYLYTVEILSRQRMPRKDLWLWRQSEHVYSQLEKPVRHGKDSREASMYTIGHQNQVT